MEEEVVLTKKEKRALAKEEKKKRREKKEFFKKLKRYGFVGVVLIFILLGGYKTLSWLDTPSTEISNDLFEVTDSDWVKGRSEAPNTLIEYSDFECIACRNLSGIVDEIRQKYPDNFKVIYRHFPLVTIHDKAGLAAQAAEAAGLQGKFWEMHDKLFETQDDWSNEKKPLEKFVEYAKELELDEERFMADYDSKEVEDQVKADMFTGNRLQIHSTPTFYLNGEKLEANSIDELKNLIEEGVLLDL